MVFNRRLRYFALGILGAIILAFGSGCVAEPSSAEPESAKRITAEQRQTMKSMNEAAEQAYESSKSGDVEQAKARIAHVSILSTKLSYDGLTTVEGIQAVTESITEAMKALNAATPDSAQISMRVACMRLTVDALSHREMPMWHEFQGPMADDLKRMDAAVKARDDTAASMALALWRGHATIIKPAVIVSHGPSDAVRLDSITAFLTNGLRSGNWEELQQAMPSLSGALEELFAEEEGRETVSPLLPTAEPPHPVFWSLGIGVFIISVLAYVAWRKYDAEQGIIKVKKERDFTRI